MLRFMDRVLRTAALLGFGAFLLTALPRALLRAVDRLVVAALRASETPQAARVRVLRPEVASVYDRLRREIPPDGEYLLIDGGTPPQASAVWARFELAPRRPRLLGRWSELPSSADLRRTWPPGVRYAVIALPERQPPLVLTEEELLAALDRSHAAR